ncbi:MAG: hypothetical protein P1V36_18360, partial [Planctomycetota bacterium]|nr:hypothetical protein [Planctomycetota bacterium]
MLDEVQALVAGSAGPQPLRLRPAREDRRPMAALRRALLPRLGGGAGARLVRTLACLHPGSPDEIRTLAAW